MLGSKSSLQSSSRLLNAVAHPKKLAKSAIDRRKIHKWYKEYVAVKWPAETTIPVQAVKDDILDEEEVEERLRAVASTINVNGIFCTLCHGRFQDWILDFNETDNLHGSKFDGSLNSTIGIEASTLKGCKFCALVFHLLKETGMLPIFRRIEARLEQIGKASSICLFSLHQATKDSGDQKQLLGLTYPGTLTYCRPLQLDAFSQPSGADFNESYEPAQHELASFPLVTKWMHECSQNHRICGSIEYTALPTRLISIDGDKLRLVLGASLAENPQYATLSYCWGRKEFIQLTLENLNDYMDEIPPDRVPETLRDAIQLVSMCGIHFIWIDALCIVQNSKGSDDWQKEASSMSTIYGGSSLNVSASSAKDVTEGCFLKPAHFVDRICTLVTFNGGMRKKIIEFQDPYKRLIRGTHLATRAWCFQEKLLAPRTLHVGSGRFAWECREKFAWENWPTGFETYAYDMSDNALVLGDRLRTRSSPDEYWSEMVHSYSATNLTFDEDRLPALAGIAREVCKKIGCTYVAGMWSQNLESQLCWTRNTVEDAETRPRPKWRAPTWSWASINGSVLPSYHSLDFSYFAHVLHSETKPLGKDPFGLITSGMMRIGYRAALSGRICVPTPNSDLDYVLVKSKRIKRKVWTTLDSDEDKRGRFNESVYLVPIRVRAVTSWSVTIEGILLRSTNGNAGEFNRVGSFWESDVVADNDSFTHLLAQEGQKVARAMCAEVIENDKYPEEPYIITVV